jgi:hypothetical protein
MTQRDAETLQEFSRVLWEATVWQVKLNTEYNFEKGFSSPSMDALCLDFHEPLAVHEKIGKHNGVGSLWIGGGAGTRLEQDGKALVGSSDSLTKGLDQFSKLVGSRLLKSVVLAPGGDTTFRFDAGLTLSCFPARSEDGNAWVIATADGNRLTLGPGVRVTYETGLR